MSVFDLCTRIWLLMVCWFIALIIRDAIRSYLFTRSLRKQHRPLFFLQRILAEESAKHGIKAGMMFINQSAFDALMRDMRKHKTPIVYSGRGVLIDGFRVLPAKVERNATSYLEQEGCQ